MRVESPFLRGPLLQHAVRLLASLFFCLDQASAAELATSAPRFMPYQQNGALHDPEL